MAEANGSNKNIINFSLSGTTPELIIKIDGIDILKMDEFKDNFIHIDAPTFLFNEYMWS